MSSLDIALTVVLWSGWGEPETVTPGHPCVCSCKMKKGALCKQAPNQIFSALHKWVMSPSPETPEGVHHLWALFSLSNMSLVHRQSLWLAFSIPLMAGYHEKYRIAPAPLRIVISPTPRLNMPGHQRAAAGASWSSCEMSGPHSAVLSPSGHCLPNTYLLSLWLP